VIVTHLSFTVDPDRMDAFISWFGPLVRRSRQHRGCVGYQHLVNPDDLTRHYLLEVWASPEALAEHTKSPEHAEIIRLGSDRFGMRDLVLHRWAEAEGHTVTARPRTNKTPGDPVGIGPVRGQHEEDGAWTR
jgi:quinol monooxygenase YgiN